MVFQYDTYCGLYCGVCHVLLANERGTLEVLAQARKQDPEQLRCQGCKSPVVRTFCARCSIKACAEARQVGICMTCNDYPCSKLTAFRHDAYPHHSIIFRNQEFIRSHGMDAWLAQQKDRWTCSTCGTRFGWYDETCPVCGSTLYSSVAEESDLGGDGS